MIADLRAPGGAVDPAGVRLPSRAPVSRLLDRLEKFRVLDPACGSGNFLYLGLQALKDIEHRAGLEVEELGLQRNLIPHTGPQNVLGIELDEYAAELARVTVWIGEIQWMRRNGFDVGRNPILKPLDTIECRDALLTADGKEAEWPAADYIVGNPPFIGGKDIRGRLGEGYVEALWAAHPHMNESADFVMYWWDRAAELLARKGSSLKRFGFVTTNSLSQVFQRRVMERHLGGKAPVSLLMAIADHPWTKATRDAAAVRIAMTVVALGEREGRRRAKAGRPSLRATAKQSRRERQPLSLDCFALLAMTLRALRVWTMWRRSL